MSRIKEIKKQTSNHHLNLYELNAQNRLGGDVRYFVASRAKAVEQMKVKTRKNTPDGVIIYSVYGEKKDQVVLIRQYRYTIGDYIYEFPAGLVEPGEDFKTGAIREMLEETGLTFQPITVDPAYEKPYFTTVGLTDESCATVYGYASGKISAEAQEDTEEIQVVLADKDEVRRILREENVAIICAYMMMHFLQDEEPFEFLKKDLFHTTNDR